MSMEIVNFSSVQSPSILVPRLRRKRDEKRAIACFQTVKNQVRVCKLWDQELLILIVRKSTPRFTNFSRLVLIRLVLIEIKRFKNVKISNEMQGHPDAVSESVRMAMHFFVNFYTFKWLYLAYYWVYLHQTWGFCKAWSALYDYVDQQLLIS